jgi:hypothetical protein
VQEELAHAIEDAGIALDQENKVNHAQLLETLRRKALPFQPKVSVLDLNQIPRPQDLIQGLEDLIEARALMYVQVILVRTRPGSSEKWLTKRTLQHLQLEQNPTPLTGEFCFRCNQEHDDASLLACLNQHGVTYAPTQIIQIANSFEVPHA